MSQSVRPLLLTAHPELLDDLLRLCAAAGVEPEVAPDAVAGRRSWLSAPLVVVGNDVAEALVRASPVRRAGVVLVGADTDDQEIWPRGLALGAEHVLFLPEAERQLVDLLASAEEGDATQAVTVSVVGGRGGAGSSTLAAALALAGMRRGLRTLLLDADPLGGGIDLVLGGEDAAGMRWPDLRDAQGRVSCNALRHALPQVDELTVLSWDRGDVLTIAPDAMRSVLTSAQRGHDLVVIDVPRRLDDAAGEALTCSTVALLLVPAEIRATAAASRVASALELVAADVRVVVRGPAPSGLSADVVASSLGLPLVGEMEAEPGIDRSLERGDPPGSRGRGPLARFCAEFLDQVVPAGGSAAA
jgi:secretion/DNA translocation related CpaE-like protein